MRYAVWTDRVGPCRRRREALTPFVAIVSWLLTDVAPGTSVATSMACWRARAGSTVPASRDPATGAGTVSAGGAGVTAAPALLLAPTRNPLDVRKIAAKSKIPFYASLM